MIHNVHIEYILPQSKVELTKKNLKIRKGHSESVNRTRPDNTGQKKKDKGTNNNLQNTTHKTKDRVTRSPLKTGGEPKCSERVSSLTPHVTPVMFLLNNTNII